MLIFFTLQIAAAIELRVLEASEPKPKSEVAEGVHIDSIFCAWFVREDTGTAPEIPTFILLLLRQTAGLPMRESWQQRITFGKSCSQASRYKYVSTHPSVTHQRTNSARYIHTFKTS